jgi:hypothetical protein
MIKIKQLAEILLNGRFQYHEAHDLMTLLMALVALMTLVMLLVLVMLLTVIALLALLVLVALAEVVVGLRALV